MQAAAAAAAPEDDADADADAEGEEGEGAARCALLRLGAALLAKGSAVLASGADAPPAALSLLSSLVACCGHPARAYAESALGENDEWVASLLRVAAGWGAELAGQLHASLTQARALPRLRAPLYHASVALPLPLLLLSFMLIEYRYYYYHYSSSSSSIAMTIPATARAGSLPAGGAPLRGGAGRLGRARAPRPRRVPQRLPGQGWG